MPLKSSTRDIRSKISAISSFTISIPQWINHEETKSAKVSSRPCFISSFLRGWFSFFLHTVHLFDLDDGGRVFGRFVLADEADHARETQRQSRAVFIERAGVDRRSSDLVGQHGDYISRLDPDVRLEARIQARGLVINRLLIEQFSELDPIGLAQSAADLADSLEAVGPGVVDRREQRADS